MGSTPPAAVPDEERIGDRDLAEWRTRTGRWFVAQVARARHRCSAGCGAGAWPTWRWSSRCSSAGASSSPPTLLAAEVYEAGRRERRPGRARPARARRRRRDPHARRARSGSPTSPTSAAPSGCRSSRSSSSTVLAAEAPLVAAGGAHGHRGRRVGAHHGARQGPQPVGPGRRWRWRCRRSRPRRRSRRGTPSTPPWCWALGLPRDARAPAPAQQAARRVGGRRVRRWRWGCPGSGSGTTGSPTSSPAGWSGWPGSAPS